MGQRLLEQYPIPNPHAGYDSEPVSGDPHEHFDSFVAQQKDALIEGLDGADGFFAHARKAGLAEQTSPSLAEAIDRIDEDALGRLGITKEEMKLIAASYGAGQDRSVVREIKIPTDAEVVGDVVRTNLGDIPIDRAPRAEDEPTAEAPADLIPRGCVVKSRGELWIVAPKLETRYPDPEQRRIVALWTMTHEMAHGIAKNDLFNTIAGLPGEPIILPDGVQVTTTAYLREMMDTSLPTTALTDYSGKYRTAAGKLPDEAEAPIGYIKALEEELCESAAATILGFVPKPGYAAEGSIPSPDAEREEFQRRTWNYLQAAPA